MKLLVSKKMMEITVPKMMTGVTEFQMDQNLLGVPILKGGCKSFIVCDENDCKYEKGLLPEETTSEDNDVKTNNGDNGDTGSGDNGDTSS